MPALSEFSHPPQSIDYSIGLVQIITVGDAEGPVDPSCGLGGIVDYGFGRQYAVGNQHRLVVTGGEHREKDLDFLDRS